MIKICDKDIDFDEKCLMKFDEKGKLVPKFSQIGSDACVNIVTHAPMLEPKLSSRILDKETPSSPEKLNFKSKISIFDKKSAEQKSNTIEKQPTLIVKDPKEIKERSTSFSHLVRPTNPKSQNLSRTVSVSVGASLDEKTGKESSKEVKPSRPSRKSLRKVSISQSFIVDSPGKRKLSPESSNCDFSNQGSGKRTTRDR